MLNRLHKLCLLCPAETAFSLHNIVSTYYSSFPRYKTCTIVSISDFCKNVKFLLIFCLFAVQCPLYFVHIAQVIVSFLTLMQVFAQMQAFEPTLPLLARLKDEDHVSMLEFH